MANLTVTFLLIALIGLMAMLRCHRVSWGEGFFDKTATNTLKGLCSIVVIFVHIPQAFQNLVQDALGSFAYVGVTGFFMISAFGMNYSRDHNPRYLKYFVPTRLISLVVPNLMINIIGVVLLTTILGMWDWRQTIVLNDYVIILLEYCALFFIVNIIARLLHLSTVVCDIVLIIAVIASSLWLYLPTLHTQSDQTFWCYERYGLIWGLLLYRFYDGIKSWLLKGNVVKSAAFFVLAVVLGVLYLKFKDVWFWGEYLLKIVLGLTILVFYFLVTINVRIENPFTHFLGNISYETYLSHGLLAMIMMILWPSLPSGAFIWVLVVATLAFSAVVHKVDNRLVKWLKSIFG